MGRRWGVLLVAALLLGALVLGAACDDDEGDGGEEPTAAETVEATEEDGAATDGDAADVEAAVRTAIDAWNGRDLEGLLAAFTDAGILDGFDATREEAMQFLAEQIGEPPLSAGELEIEVSGDTATATSTYFFGALGSREQLNLVREGDAWLIDGSDYVQGDAPEGAAEVELSLLEYSFEFDPAGITSGDIAFQASNIGGEEHEILLASIPADLNLETAVTSPEEPEGVEVLAFVGPFSPGDATTILASEPLAPGRYALLCFIENADGVEHATLGMFADFTIQ